MREVIKPLLAGVLVGVIVMTAITLMGPRANETASQKTYEEALRYPTDPMFSEDIVIVSDISATATATPTEIVVTATNTPTSTPTATNTPKPTATPTKKSTSTPKPTATPKPQKQTANIVPYPTGKVGTQYVDDKTKHTWKPYARYTAITAKGTAEYKLRYKEWTDEHGLRVVEDPNGVMRYAIALEPQWAGGQSVDIGRCIDIKMANGATLHCVLADCKKHENSLNQEGRYGSKGELVEFIVDVNKLPTKARNSGDISYVSKEFEGGFVSVTVLDLYIEGFGR